MRVTRWTLLKLGACRPSIDLFNAIFPDGAEINRENISRAEDAGLSLGWFIRHQWGEPYYRMFHWLLTSEASRMYYVSQARAFGKSGRHRRWWQDKTISTFLAVSRLAEAKRREDTIGVALRLLTYVLVLALASITNWAITLLIVHRSTFGW